MHTDWARGSDELTALELLGSRGAIARCRRRRERARSSASRGAGRAATWPISPRRRRPALQHGRRRRARRRGVAAIASRTPSCVDRSLAALRDGASRGPFARRRSSVGRGRGRRRSVGRRGDGSAANVVFFASAEHATAGIRARRRAGARAPHGARRRRPWLALNPVEREDYRQDRLSRSRGRRRRHRAASDLAHQGGRPLARAGRGRAAISRRSPFDHVLDGRARRRRRVDFGDARHREVPRHGGGESRGDLPIPRCSCSAASWPPPRICCSSPCAPKWRRRLPPAMMQALTRSQPATLGVDAAGDRRRPARAVRARNDRPVRRRSGAA